MKKRIVAVCMVCSILIGAVVTVGAYTPEQQRAAEALYELGLLKGTGNGFELDNTLNRVEGVTMVVRMVGAEDESQSGIFQTPFNDVDNWALGYVGFAYTNGITNGISATEFGSQDKMVDYMFLTLTLRALSYTDKGDDAQFVWDNPYALAKEVGLIDSVEPNTDFRRGDAILIFWNALQANLAFRDITLADYLINNKVFTEKQYEQAKRIIDVGADASATETDTTSETTNETRPVLPIPPVFYPPVTNPVVPDIPEPDTTPEPDPEPDTQPDTEEEPPIIITPPEPEEPDVELDEDELPMN